MKVYKPQKWSLVVTILIITGVGLVLFALNNEGSDIRPVLFITGVFGTIDLFAYLGTNGLSRFNNM